MKRMCYIDYTKQASNTPEGQKKKRCVLIFQFKIIERKNLNEKQEENFYFCFSFIFKQENEDDDERKTFHLYIYTK